MIAGNCPPEKCGFRVTVSKPASHITVDLPHPDRRCSSTRLNGVTLVLLGEVVGEKGLLSASEILDRFQRGGADCARDFDGSFVLLFVPETPGPLLVVTDPLNSLKCFIEETPESFTLVSSLGMLPPRTRSPDRVGLVSFLANGVIYNNRTIFESVRSLRRASIHTVDAGRGVSSKAYWQYRFDHAFERRSRGDLKRELASLLFRAAQRRVDPSETICLSLSGGYDSTCVLGLLAKSAPGKVKCFSYMMNRGTAGSDEEIAARMARIAGFDHETVPSFNGDIVDLIRRNAAWGECRANFCGELDFWRNIGADLAGNAVFFVGDECFGWTGCRLKSEREVLASLPIRLSRSLAPYADCLDLEAPAEEFDREILRLTEDALESDLHDTKDFLYLDQRLGNVIMPWRELFAGRYAPVRNVLLDRAVIDFMAHLPSRFRLGKNLYKETVRMMFPELFRVRRAFKPAVNPFKTALFEQRGAIEEELTAGKSLVDAWLDPEKCRRLLPSSRPSEALSFKSKAVLFGKKLLKESPLAHSLFSLLPPKPLPAVDPGTLLTRVLLLRNYLSF